MNKALLGIGLRSVHYAHLLEEPQTQIRWFEAISENYMGTQGRPLEILEKIRRDFPVALHGVSLSIGAVGAPNLGYLKKLRELIHRIDPLLVSDHLCWTGDGHANIHDLLPMPFTRESLNYLAVRLDQAQSLIGRQLLLENVSSYLTYKHSEMTEWEFLAELVQKSGCKILLDINNVYVSSMNHGFEPQTYLDAIAAEWVGQIHLAGFTDMGNFLFDTHSKAVHQSVWDLYERTIQRMPEVPVLLEWDEDIPPFSRVEAEALKAKSIWDKYHA